MNPTTLFFGKSTPKSTKKPFPGYENRFLSLNWQTLKKLILRGYPTDAKYGTYNCATPQALTIDAKGLQFWLLAL
jgi:hypothetical protein